MFGGGIDDGSPVFISNPKFYRNRQGETILRVNYKLNKPAELPNRAGFVMWFRAGEQNPNGYGNFLQVPRYFGRSELQNEGTLDLGMAKLLELSNSYGQSLPAANVFWEADGERISNNLSVNAPTNPGSLPIDPQVVDVEKQTQSFRVTLANAQYDGSFIPKMFVNLHPQGSPSPRLDYYLVCKQMVQLGGVSKSTKLDKTLLARGGRIEVESFTGFHFNSTYELKVEAYPPRQKQNATTVSNIVNMPGPPRR